MLLSPLFEADQRYENTKVKTKALLVLTYGSEVVDVFTIYLAEKIFEMKSVQLEGNSCFSCRESWWEETDVCREQAWRT